MDTGNSESLEPRGRILDSAAQALLPETQAPEVEDDPDIEARRGLQRIPGLSTELDDVTEVEYRQLRLERVVLVGVHPPGEAVAAEHSLRELAALAETAGAQVLDGLLQSRAHPDPSTYVGRGKAEELRELVRSTGADTVIADRELAPSQRRALEDVLKVKVIDRTVVILDIFSQHARSREGKAQVELAQMEYLLPRLRGWGESMSRQAGGQVGGQAGGMGSRGPGETKIELDRRRIRTRMARLRAQIREMKTARDTKNRQRLRRDIPGVAIVGYTNAGKSSLINRLTSARMLVENALFATLDPATRRTRTPSGRIYTLTDTVGFIRNLPHQLVEAFRSTLDAAETAAVTLHLVDASHPDPLQQIAVVREVLREVQSPAALPTDPQQRELIVFNKADLIDAPTRLYLSGVTPEALFISTATGEGLEQLQLQLERLLPADLTWELQLPYAEAALLSLIYRRGEVLEREDAETGVFLRARLPGDLLAAVAPYRRNSDKTETYES